MHNIKRLWIAGSVVSFFGITSGAIAADASGCYGAYYVHVDTLEVAANHLVMTVNSHGTGYVTKDPSAPHNGAAGPCLTFIEIIDGKPTGQSKCVRTDTQGDKFLIVGTMEGFNATGMKGKWTLTGLTGKWVGASGGGEWWDGGSRKGDKSYFNCFNGSYQMKKK